MILQKRIFITLLMGCGLLSQALPALAVRVKYSIDFFSIPTTVDFFSDIQKVIGTNEYRFVKEGTLVQKNKVGSGFFTYDTDNTVLTPTTSLSPIFNIDEISLTLRGRSFMLDDFTPVPKTIGSQFRTIEEGTFVNFALNPLRDETLVPKVDPQTGLLVVPKILIQSDIGEFNQVGSGCIFPATRCLEEQLVFRGNPSTPSPFPPRQFIETYPPFGYWTLSDSPEFFGPLSDKGFFFTSLEEPKQVPEPSTQIFEVLSSLLLFAGLLRLRFLKTIS
jgi:hypothetical protein